MNTEEFYMLIPGAIGTVDYIAKTENPTEEKMQNISNHISSSNFGSYLANYMLTKGGNTPDPAEAFSKFRREAAQEAENYVGNPKQQRTYVQIGQKESLEKISKIESSPNFVKWVDERLISLIKSVPDEKA